MKCGKTLFALCVALVATSAIAEQKIIELWSGSPPPSGAQVKSTPKTITKRTDVPSLSFFAAKSDKPCSVVIIAPGGGYNVLCDTYEGDEIAKTLNEWGISAVVLRYRVPNDPVGALQDIQRAIRVVRNKAAQLNIDPKRLGVFGFSAGANLCARASANFKENSYQPSDTADKLSARPDLTCLVYPAYCDEQGNAKRFENKAPAGGGYDAKYALAKNLKIDADTPRAYIVQSHEDPYINASIAYYLALREAGVPANLLLLDRGKHGFILNKNQYTDNWKVLLRSWLKENGFQ